MDTEDETIFSSPKSLMGLFFIGSITIYVIYWIYNNIIKDNSTNSNQNIFLNALNSNNNMRNNNNHKKLKQKMSINMSLLMKDNKRTILEDIKTLYDLFDKLSDFYNLYLLIYIEDNINAEKIKDNILKYLEPIIKDNIVYAHRILFCTSIEGLTAIIRSLDSFIHIENDRNIIVHLIRYINEFWFVSTNNEKEEIQKKIENDSNNSKQNIKDLMDKIKFYNNWNQVIEKEIINK